MSFNDHARAIAIARFCAVVETVTRWLALLAIIATQWHWFSLSNSLSLFPAMVALLAVPLWAMMLLISAINSGWAAAPYRWRRRGVAIAVCLMLGVSALLTHWPFYAAFALSKPFLNRLADCAAAGANVSGWHWAGVWVIKDVHVELDGSVGMYFDRDLSGWCGVVRYSSASTAPVGSNNGRRPLGGPWELVDED